MSSLNKIFKKVPVGMIQKNGRNIPVSVATSTVEWTRPSDICKKQGPGLIEAIKDSIDDVFPNAKELVMRESKHQSDADERDHYTVVQMYQASDDNNVKNNGKTTHFPTSK